MTITKAEVKQFAKALGKSAEDISIKLKKSKCRGVRYSPTSCPVAVAINKKFPGAAASVEWEELFFWILDKNGNTVRHNIKTPRVIRDFIVDFDKKKFPGLIKKTKKLSTSELIASAPMNM